MIINILIIIQGNMDYKIFELESPIDKDSFDEFTKKEASIYFEWYMNSIDKRIKYLENYINAGGNSIVMDYGVDSLVSVWGWYEKTIKVEHFTQIELKKEAMKYPDWLRDEIMSDDTKIADETLAICSDLAIYFAEVLRRNKSDILYWGYYTKPKNRMSVNEPVLLGFVKGTELDPRRVLYNCTLHSIEKSDENMLKDLYYIWMSYVNK